MTRLLILALSLVLTTPAFALNYTGTASFDWAALTFSGIPVTIGDDSIHLHAVFIGNETDKFGQWGSDPISATIASVGSARTDASDIQVFTALTLTGEGQTSTSVLRELFFAADATGDLTVRIPYQLNHEGGEGITATALAQVDLTRVEETQHAEAVLTLPDTAGSGFLSVSHFFTLGDQGSFNSFLSLSATAPHGASVPVPDLFWPSLFTMLVLAWALLRRRHGRR